MRIARPARTVSRWTRSIASAPGPGSQAERARLLEEIGEAIEVPEQMTYGSQAAAASQVFEQQRDLAMRERASQHLEAVDAALARLDDGSYGTLPPMRPADRGGAARGAALGGPLHRVPDDRRPRPPLSVERRRRRAEQAALVTIEAIRAAAETLRGVAVRTPLVAFGDPADRRWLKAESLQPIGAFKIRGAYVAVASLTPDERARGVITYSSGNHAQGVARAARLLGAPAVVVMPSDAPAIKRERVAADGAEIVVVGTASDERRRVAEIDRGRTRPVDHPAVRRRPDHRRPGDGRPRDRRGPAGPGVRPRPDRRRRAGQRRRRRRSRRSDRRRG